MDKFTEQTEVQTDNSELDGKYLTFWTDGQLFGIPIINVVQIIQMQEITEIPDFPSYAKGIINLRGAMIPLIDIRLRLGKMPTDYNERTCIIVTNIQSLQVGLIVDEVNEVTDVAEESVSPPPRMSGGDYTSRYLTGIANQGGTVVLLISPDRILSDDMISDLQSYM